MHAGVSLAVWVRGRGHFTGEGNRLDRTNQQATIDVREIQCRGAACCARSGKAFAVSENNTIFCGYQ